MLFFIQYYHVSFKGSRKCRGIQRRSCFSSISEIWSRKAEKNNETFRCRHQVNWLIAVEYLIHFVKNNRLIIISDSDLYFDYDFTIPSLALSIVFIKHLSILISRELYYLMIIFPLHYHSFEKQFYCVYFVLHPSRVEVSNCFKIFFLPISTQWLWFHYHAFWRKLIMRFEGS